MDTCLNTKVERLESEDVADLRKDLLLEFSDMSECQVRKAAGKVSYECCNGLCLCQDPEIFLMMMLVLI